MKFDRALVGPGGEVRYCPDHEHDTEAQAYLREQGASHSLSMASSILAGKGWLRLSRYGRFTDPLFCAPKRITQAQRDVLFDMAMDAQAQGNTYEAKSLMEQIAEIGD